MSNTSNVIYLHGSPQPIAHFLRVGSMHRQLEEMLHQGKLPVARFIFDAGRMREQSDLLSALRRAGCELILDSNVAELAAIGRYQGFARNAPWGRQGEVLLPLHVTDRANELDIIGRISRFAIDHGFNRVLSPSGFFKSVNDEWFSASIEACHRLRRSLDKEGGEEIALDFPLVFTNAMLNDTAERKVVISMLGEIPFDSVWLRVSGFGADSTGVAVRKLISAAQDFRDLGKPIVLDCVGGLAAQAVVAFGAASGIAHGLASKERFDASGWDKPPKEKNGGGGGYTVLLPGIDRLLKPNDAAALMACSGARRQFSCNDKSCCPHGYEDTERDPRGHYLRQRAKQFRSLSDVPDLVRAKHFLENELAHVERLARQAAKLKPSSSSLTKILQKNSKRVERMNIVLKDLEKTMTKTLLPGFEAVAKDIGQPNVGGA